MKFPHKITIYVVIYLVVLCYASFCDAQINFLQTADSVVLEKAYIIEYEPSLSSGIILNRIRDAGINYTFRYNLDIIDSVSVMFNLNDDVIRCSRLSGVKTIWPVSRMKPRLFFAHKLTGVDVFRQKTGFDGTGVNVGIVDTGLDYRHPALGNCFKTPGCKTQFGFDLIGSGTAKNPMPDDNPFEDSCSTGHGTHIAGIIAADDHILNFTGVAPGVTLGIYRALDCNEQTFDDIIIQGLNLADKDGMDVINLSLGGAFQAWSDTPVGVAIKKLTDKGIVIVVAAGENPNGLFAAGDPDSAATAITVGSVDNLKFLSFVLTISSNSTTQIPYLTTAVTDKFFLDGPLPLVIANTSRNLPESDGCSSYTKDLTGTIALIRRGGCGFDTKNQNAQAAGAVGSLFYNNDTSIVVPLVLSVFFPSAIVTNVDGEFLKNEIRRNQNITISFPFQTLVVDHPNAGRPSPSSSWGPTFEFDIKPEVLAPGGRIFSTWLNSDYATLSGTSFSSAYATGVVALYLQATNLRRGTVDPVKLRDLFTYSAKPYFEEVRNTNLAVSPDKQGGGLIDINEAIKTKIVINPSKLLLNDSAHFNGTHTITLKNTGNMTTKYTLSHIKSASVRGFFKLWIDSRLLVFEKKFAGVKFSTNCVIVRPGMTAKIKIRFTEPRNLKNDFAVYSGFISIKDSAFNTTSTVPYLGVKGDIRKIPILSNNPAPFLAKDNNFTTIFNKPNQVVTFTFIGSDFPTTSYFLNYGTRLAKLELYKKGDFTPHGFVGLLDTVIHFNNPDIQTPRNGGTGDRGITNKPWNSRLVRKTPNGNSFRVPAGKYQILVSILRPFGNPKNKHDFVTWESPILNIIDVAAPANQTYSATPTPANKSQSATTTPTTT